MRADTARVRDFSDPTDSDVYVLVAQHRLGLVVLAERRVAP